MMGRIFWKLLEIWEWSGDRDRRLIAAVYLSPVVVIVSIYVLGEYARGDASYWGPVP